MMNRVYICNAPNVLTTVETMTIWNNVNDNINTILMTLCIFNFVKDEKACKHIDETDKIYVHTKHTSRSLLLSNVA